MTILIATSVVRGTRQGDSHGGVYLIDIDGERVRQPIDWNTTDIDWQGRGWDRGLRGIAFDHDRVFIAASDELFAYTPGFGLIGSWRCPYLKHCHEITRFERRLYLASTGFDSVLAFDLDSHRFTLGLHLSESDGRLQAATYDPGGRRGPPAGNRLHLNSVFAERRGLFIAGLRTGALLVYTGKRIEQVATLPEGTHNARPFLDGMLFNDTACDVVRFVSQDKERVFAVPRYPDGELTHGDFDDSRIARQAFGRGLCVVDGHVIAAGSSPSTVTLHDLDAMTTSVRINLTMDVRNAIHGLEVWPFGT